MGELMCDDRGESEALNMNENEGKPELLKNALYRISLSTSTVTVFFLTVLVAYISGFGIPVSLLAGIAAGSAFYYLLRWRIRTLLTK